MKIAVAQQNYHIGNFESNIAKIIGAIKQAKKEGADLVVFSELSVCGYAPRDFLEFNDFINLCYAGVDQIKEHADTIGVIVGVTATQSFSGRERPLSTQPGSCTIKKCWVLAQKTLLPNYDVFDEYRYFEPAFDWKVIEFKGNKIALHSLFARIYGTSEITCYTALHRWTN